MNQAPVNAEARGRVREWKRKAAARFAVFERQLDETSLSDEIVTFALRGSLKGRARAFEKIRRRFAAAATLEGVRLDGAHPLAVWAVLKPRVAVALALEGPDGDEEPLEPRDGQNCVVVEYLVAGALPERAGTE